MVLPDGAGSFSKNIVNIRNGQSEDFMYSPGTAIGTHNLSLSIPGLGLLNDIPLTLVAGDPMYITHTEANGNIFISVRDRYGNIAPFSGKGTITQNADSPQEIQFQDGQYIMSVRKGFYVVNIPDLEKNSIHYAEN